jgi:hypothetical protein
VHLIAETFPRTGSDEWIKILANLVVLNYGSLLPFLTPKVCIQSINLWKISIFVRASGYIPRR